MQEIWKNIKGYEGLYQVSNYGKVRSLDKKVKGSNQYGKIFFVTKKGKQLKSRIKNGYCNVHLIKNGVLKEFTIHRLVAEAFIPNPNNLPQVNHKDENKANNYVENLEWCTRSYNCSYGSRCERIWISRRN